ncbi:hypothetical protein Tco_0973307 [Tanacetum coccineum]
MGGGTWGEGGEHGRTGTYGRKGRKGEQGEAGVRKVITSIKNIRTNAEAVKENERKELFNQQNERKESCSKVIPGRVLVPPGSVVVPTGSVVVPTGSVVVPTGSVVVPTGSVITTGSDNLFSKYLLKRRKVLVVPEKLEWWFEQDIDKEEERFEGDEDSGEI